MQIYTAYGLLIDSEIPLSEFTPAVGAADVVVRWLEGVDWAHEHSDKDYHAEVSPSVARFWFSEIGTVLVRDGNAIDIYPAAHADKSLARLYVEGMIMAMLLYQRGFCVLHASVVEIAGRAIAFLGPVGAGKSSIAAALQEQGHALLSDDNAAVQLAGNSLLVMSAYPYLKLFPAVAAFLGYGDQRLGVLHSSQKKLAGSAESNFKGSALPLDTLYFIGREYSSEIQPVSASELLIQLVRHSVPTRWGVPGDREHLERCGALAGKVQAFTLRTFYTLECLPVVARTIEEHCIRNRMPPTISDPPYAGNPGVTGVAGPDGYVMTGAGQQAEK